MSTPFRSQQVHLADLKQENHGNAQDMPKLFDDVQGVLSDLDGMKESLETASDGIDVEPELVSELGKLSEISKSELNGMFSLSASDSVPDKAQLSSKRSSPRRPQYHNSLMTRNTRTCRIDCMLSSSIAGLSALATTGYTSSISTRIYGANTTIHT